MERLCEKEFKSIVAGRKAGEQLAFIEKEIWDMDLSGMDLSGMDFTLSSFQNTVLNGVDFEGSSVENALFDGCGLRGANFRNAEMKTASFRYCDMRECNIKGANLFGAVPIWRALFPMRIRGGSGSTARKRARFSAIRNASMTGWCSSLSRRMPGGLPRRCRPAGAVRRRC